MRSHLNCRGPCYTSGVQGISVEQRNFFFSRFHPMCVFFSEPFHFCPPKIACYRAPTGSAKTSPREPRSPIGPPKNWEETLVSRRKSQAIFDGRRRVPRKFHEFSGDRVPSDFKEMGGNKASLPFAFFYRPMKWVGKKILKNGREETLLCRRKSQAIFDGRGRVPRKFYEFSGDRVPSDFFKIGGNNGKKKKSEIFFPSKNWMQFSRDKSIIYLYSVPRQENN